MLLYNFHFSLSFVPVCIYEFIFCPNSGTLQLSQKLLFIITQNEFAESFYFFFYFQRINYTNKKGKKKKKPNNNKCIKITQ